MEIVEGLYGTTFEKQRACGFCTHHNCYVTVKQLRQHECLKKQCWHLNKNNAHSWWKQREATKAKRIARKERLSEIVG